MQKADTNSGSWSTALEREANRDTLLGILAGIRDSSRISLDSLRNALEQMILAVIRGRNNLEHSEKMKTKKNPRKRIKKQPNMKNCHPNARVLMGIDSICIVITENEIKRKQKIISLPLKETLCKYDLGLLLCMKITSRPKTAIEKQEQNQETLEYNELTKVMVKNTARIYQKKCVARFYPLWAATSTRFLRCFLSKKQLLPLLKKEIAPKVTVTKYDKIQDTEQHDSNGLVWVTVDGIPLVRFTKHTSYDAVCLDCEMVRTKKGLEVGHVAIIDKKGNTVYNKIVIPKYPVIDYLTEFSGLSPSSFNVECDEGECVRGCSEGRCVRGCSEGRCVRGCSEGCDANFDANFDVRCDCKNSDVTDDVTDNVTDDITDNVTDKPVNLIGIKNQVKNDITNHITNPCKNHNHNHNTNHSQVITQERMRSDLAGIIGVNTIIIGHSLTNDLYALGIYHKKLIDTSFLFQGNNGIYKMKLKDIAKKYLGKDIQEQQHSPVEDAVATLQALNFAIRHREETKTAVYQQLHKKFSPLVHFPDLHPSQIRKNRLNLIFSTETPSIIKRTLYINCFIKQNEWQVSVFFT